jgi:hypothetical protein
VLGDRDRDLVDFVAANGGALSSQIADAYFTDRRRAEKRISRLVLGGHLEEIALPDVPLRVLVPSGTDFPEPDAEEYAPFCARLDRALRAVDVYLRLAVDDGVFVERWIGPAQWRREQDALAWGWITPFKGADPTPLALSVLGEEDGSTTTYAWASVRSAAEADALVSATTAYAMWRRNWGQRPTFLADVPEFPSLLVLAGTRELADDLARRLQQPLSGAYRVATDAEFFARGTAVDWRR